MKAKLHRSDQEKSATKMDRSKEKDQNESGEDDKPRSRQSKRNVNKVVKYHEFEDENSGEEDDVRPRGRQSKRKRGDSPDDEFDDDGVKKKKKSPPRSKGRKQIKERRDDSESEEEEKPKKEKGGSSKKLNQTSSDYSSIDFSCKKSTEDGKAWNFKISSWNVGGLKAWIKKDGLQFLKHEKPDIFCLQEIRCSERKLPPEAKLEGYHAYWLMGDKEGYAGVGLYSKTKPLEVKYGLGNKEHDTEGRLITAEYDKFFLVVAYVPNAGRGLVTLPKRMKWDPELRKYLKQLNAKKPVILCGDLNVSHQSIDLANPKSNARNAGFTQEERDGMTSLLKEGFIDTFRHMYPEKGGAYTFWTYMGNARSRNVGWRLDYFIISERLLPKVCDNIIRSQVYGSDHCPITLLLHL